MVEFNPAALQVFECAVDRMETEVLARLDALLGVQHIELEGQQVAAAWHRRQWWLHFPVTPMSQWEGLVPGQRREQQEAKLFEVAPESVFERGREVNQKWRQGLLMIVASGLLG